LEGNRTTTSTRRKIIATLVLIPIGLVILFSLYLANTAGELPWQTDPTRIPITPFANLPTSVPDAGTPTPGS
jgi:hypothetical protein